MNHTVHLLVKTADTACGIPLMLENNLRLGVNADRDISKVTCRKCKATQSYRQRAYVDGNDGSRTYVFNTGLHSMLVDRGTYVDGLVVTPKGYVRVHSSGNGRPEKFKYTELRFIKDGKEYIKSIPKKAYKSRYLVTLARRFACGIDMKHKEGIDDDKP